MTFSSPYTEVAVIYKKLTTHTQYKPQHYALTFSSTYNKGVECETRVKVNWILSYTEVLFFHIVSSISSIWFGV